MRIQSWSLAAVLVTVVTVARAAEPQYQWRQTNDGLALISGEHVLWQFIGKQGEGKPSFHPLALPDGTPLTAWRPADHPWHLGLWWSWKYINGVNYWEEDKTTHRSEGVTEVLTVQSDPKPDGSARLELGLTYHPPGQPPVLTEKRVLFVSAPDAKGNYAIDWDATYTAGPANLKFDRTPPSKGAGGYAGLSLRFARNTRGWIFTSSEGAVGATNIYGKFCRWVDYSSGPGIAMFDHPQNLRHPTPWYPNAGHPFLNPSFLFHEPYTLEARKTLRFRYRVLVHAEKLDAAALEQQWKDFAGKK